MEIKELDRETLLGVIEDFAKNWLAHTAAGEGQLTITRKLA